jgi:putative acyl-CoA dehydrogenase
LLQRHGAPEAADTFSAGRLDGQAGAYGTLPPGPALRKIVDTARPAG